MFFEIRTTDKEVHLKEKLLVDGTNTLKCTFIENPVITTP
jgi:hypothetical protein